LFAALGIFVGGGVLGIDEAASSRCIRWPFSLTRSPI